MYTTHLIEATIIYDGKIFPDCIMSGHALHFRIPDVMPGKEFLSFGGLVVEAPIPYGQSGNARFWIVATDRERDSLVPGGEFVLHAARDVVARGRILSARRKE